MSDQPSTTSGDLPPDAARRLEAVCNRFEAAWKSQTPPRVEDFLDGWTGTERDALLRELVALDVVYRRARGEVVNAEEYQDRFPDIVPISFAGAEPEAPPAALTPPQPDDSAATRYPDTPADINATGPFTPMLNGPPHGSMHRRFGGYELLEELGRGGMGVVYRAWQFSLKRHVAVKMILTGQLAVPADIQRFLTEAENAASLDHPNIVPIYEVGGHDGQHFFSMKLIEGTSLERQADAYTADPRAAAGLLATVARAVHHAHQRGVLHRDLKPANILLDAEGEPHVADFGLAKRFDGEGVQTISGAIVGTPNYMAPEQAAGRNRGLTTAVDVYALGTVLYRCLAGRPPFPGETVLDTLLRVQYEEPEPPRKVRPGVPRDLEVICLKCLNKDPARRYASAEALAEDLAFFLDGKPIRARPVGRAERVVKWARRRPALAAAYGLLLVAILAGGVLGILGVAYFVRQNGEAAAALAEGKDLLLRGLPTDAKRSLKRGQSLVGSIPWSTSLAAELAEKERQAQRAEGVQGLHRTVDDLRFHYDLQSMSSTEAGKREAECGRLWDKRRDLDDVSLNERSLKEENQVRDDLRDLAVLSTALRGRMADGESAEARRQQLDRLDEAEALFGPSAVLQHERARLRPAAANALELPPVTAWDHYALGRALFRDGKMEPAAVELEHAAMLEPQGFWPNFYQGVCAYRRQRYTEAEAALRVCVALAPNVAACHYNHGLAENALGRRDRARADYDRALQLEPAYADAWLNRGSLNHQEKREDKALEDLHQALAHGADAASVHYNLAMVQEARGDLATAVAEVLSTIALRPDYPGARELYARLKASASPDAPKE